MITEQELQEGLKNENKARELIKRIQEACDELVKVKDEALKAANNAVALCDQYNKMIEDLTSANRDMATVLKNVHIALNAEKELWEKSQSITELVDILARFVVSAGAIKAGVKNATHN